MGNTLISYIPFRTKPEYTKQQIAQIGKNYRQNLYERIKFFEKKYQQQFNQINQQTKQKIILMSALELVQLLDSRLITSFQLVLIFAYRTATIGIQNNYVFDQMFQQAIQLAIKCDQQRKMYPNKKCWNCLPRKMNEKQLYCQQNYFSPFYGIPASYKQNLKIKNKHSHIGFTICHPKNHHQQNGLFVQLTLLMGFIPFVRTNVPLSCKTIQTNNNIFGYSMNPWDKSRSCGGSSGGQGGLIGAYCSPIGFGTDIGGSLRIPAEWCGLVTLKPASRYSRLGNSYYGKISGGLPIKADIAPISRTVNDQIAFLNFMCDQRNYTKIPKSIIDPYLNLKAFKPEIFIQKPKLKIGYITHLKTLQCSRSHQRVVNEAVQILRKDGHQVKQIKLQKLQDLYFALMQLFLADGTMKTLQEISFGQPLTQQFKLMSTTTKVPNFIKSIAIWALKSRQPQLCRILQNSKSRSVSQTLSKIYQMQTQLCNQIYNDFISNDIESLILPGFAFTSPRLGTVNKLQYCYSYTTGWNVLNYPVGVVPMGIVKMNQTRSIFYSKGIGYQHQLKSQIHNNLQGSQGLPVGVQVVSLPFKEQNVLYLMNILEQHVKFRHKYPCSNILKQK